MLSKLSHPKFSIVVSLAAVALTGIFGNASPANAASITYSRWLNVGDATVGDNDNGNFTLKIKDDTELDAKYKDYVLFEFSATNLNDATNIATIYFNDRSGLFAKKADKSYDASPLYIDADARDSKNNSGLSFAYDDKTSFSQGNSIQLTTDSQDTLNKPSFAFNNIGTNKTAIQTGETLGILVKLNSGKNFVNILEGLTQVNGLMVAAHLTGYSGGNGGKSDGFYYGNPYKSKDSLTETPTTAAGYSSEKPLFYDSYGTESDPNPKTNPLKSNPTTAPGSAVPEPLTILGATTAAALGATFKRRFRQSEK